MDLHRLLGISGSLRKGSTNTKLVLEASRLFGPADFSLADLNLPLYDGDAEDANGIPASVQMLSDQIASADAIIISTPEYNKALSGDAFDVLGHLTNERSAKTRGALLDQSHATIR